jgi:hypothetical protein
MSAQHTPGPWRIDSHTEGVYIVNTIRSEAQPVARTVAPNSVANAHLIAAAPDLLNVAHAASHALKSYEYGNASPELARTCAAALDEAIAKAEGRT